MSVPSPLAGIPELVPIPAGEYEMGQCDGRAEERPVHLVRISAFSLARIPVTNAQFDAFARAAGRRATRFRNDALFSHPTQPVVGPTWQDAVDYCHWLGEKTGRPFRLPTEAEWEWAARGGLAGKLYPWGDEPPESRPGYAARWRQAPETVAASAANGYGLYDMCENVHEWCADWYDAGYYAVSPRDNPAGPAAGTRRSSRGGAWRHQVKIARCAARSSIPPHLEYSDYGFRVACDVA